MEVTFAVSLAMLACCAAVPLLWRRSPASGLFLRYLAHADWPGLRCVCIVSAMPCCCLHCSVLMKKLHG
jgi:hypothetical protein